MSTPLPIVAVLAGGTSAERDVSLGSGRASALALARSYPTQLFELTADALPAGLEIALSVEDRAIVLPKRTDPKAKVPVDLTPQVMLYSSGELTGFQLRLTRSGTARSALLTGTAAGKLDVGQVVEKTP